MTAKAAEAVGGSEVGREVTDFLGRAAKQVQSTVDEMDEALRRRDEEEKR